MKIAVYTIALNEEKHVRRWYESCKNADLVLIADTGSTDKTRYLAKSIGITVQDIHVSPWRFDVARNASLALIPADFDICIQLDMDEILPMGWRDIVEAAFETGNLWPIYKHVTSRYEDGTARTYQNYFKIHPRHGFWWKYPIHEILVHGGEIKFDRKEIDLEVEHIRDTSKKRDSYLPLLELAVREDPKDWRMNHYLNREYFYNRNWLQVLKSGYKCSEIMDGWDVERASTYMWMSEAARWLDMMPLAKYWASEATKAAPKFYEAWHWRAHIAHLMEEWSDAREFASKIETLHKGNHHLVKPEVWEWWGYDLLALANHKLNNQKDAIKYGAMALMANPNEQRLKSNLEFYQIASKQYEIKENISSENRKILWAIFARNTEKFLEYYLDCLMKQTWPKRNIYLMILTNDNTDNTEKILEEFLARFGTEFLGVHYEKESINPDLKNITNHEWNSTTLNVMGELRQKSIDFAMANNFDLYFTSDCDNFLIPQTLEKLISLNLPCVAPLLRCSIPTLSAPGISENKYYSNFHFEINSNYSFKDSEIYRKIMDNDIQGVIQVPLVHCTYLLKKNIFGFVNYMEIEGNWEYRNFAISLNKAKVEQFIDARRTYGYLTLSNHANRLYEDMDSLI